MRIVGSASANAKRSRTSPLPPLAIGGMVPILLAAPGVAARRLNMSVGGWTNPHIRPGGRYDKRLDAAQNGGIGDPFALRIDIDEALARSSSPNGGPVVADISQAAEVRRRDIEGKGVSWNQASKPHQSRLQRLPPPLCPRTGGARTAPRHRRSRTMDYNRLGHSACGFRRSASGQGRSAAATNSSRPGDRATWPRPRGSSISASTPA